MAKYRSSGSQTLTSSIHTALVIGSNATTVQRNWIHEYIIANVGTPADLVTLHTVQRTTAIGVQIAVVPTVNDFADRAAQADVGEDSDPTGPTYTSAEEIDEIPLNNRALYRWVAAPGWEIVCPATAGDGVGWGATHASATTDWRIQLKHSE